jgi:hypothetical protein
MIAKSLTLEKSREQRLRLQRIKTCAFLRSSNLPRLKSADANKFRAEQIEEKSAGWKPGGFVVNAGGFI